MIKTFLIEGNKLYSPETCVFITYSTNLFLVARNALRGKYMLGVSWDKNSNKFRADCNDGNVRIYLGLFTCELEAHLAWKKYKHGLACKLADKQTDSRVAEVLRKRYL